MQAITLLGLNLSVNYLHKPKGRQTYYYRRNVPADLTQHYSTKTIIKSLKTRHDTEAALACTEINTLIETEFARLRAGLDKNSSVSSYEAAKQLLLKEGLTPSSLNQQDIEQVDKRDAFYEKTDDELQRNMGRKDYESWFFNQQDTSAPVVMDFPYHHLSPERGLALKMLKNKFRPPASDYPALYIQAQQRRDDPKFCNKAKVAMEFLLEVLADKPPAQYTRAELNQLINHHIAYGKRSPASIDRILRTLRAMFNKVSLEFDLHDDKNHVFINLKFPQLETTDTTDRKEFTKEQLSELRKVFNKDKKQPATMLMIGLLMDTGLRINEACGLRLEDVSLKSECPYICIHRNSFRRLKTKNSKRFIPLVGCALEAIVALKSQARGSEWVFEGYVDEVKGITRNDSASEHVNKLLRKILGEEAPTSYGFRHAITTRLRNNNCSKEILEQLNGWSKSTSDRYGSQHDLKTKKTYLQV